MQLFEKWRPRRLADVVGQPKVLAEIETLRKHGGLSGRAYWITGKPGTGKTTIARCLAAELDPMGMNTFEAGRPDCSWSTFGLSELDQFRHCIRFRPMGSTSWVLIVNEAHGMGKELCRRLNQFLDGLPDYVTVIFTTTLEAGGLFEDAHATGDSRMLLQRCTELTLTTQGLAAAFAGRLHEIAKAEGLNGQPAERYVEWFKRHKGTCMREALEALNKGTMFQE